jgi:hypothetical protein
MFSQLVEYHIRNDLNLIKQSVLTFNSFFLRVGFLFLFFEESFRGLVFFGCDSNDQLQTDLPRIEAPLLHSIVTYIYMYMARFFSLWCPWKNSAPPPWHSQSLLSLCEKKTKKTEVESSLQGNCCWIQLRTVGCVKSSSYKIGTPSLWLISVSTLPGRSLVHTFGLKRWALVIATTEDT